jgi:two-component system sensor histidine kinase PilS (NtrC family)
VSGDRRRGDRRRADRRLGDRRRRPGEPDGGADRGPTLRESSPAERESFFDAGWMAAGDLPPDSRPAAGRSRQNRDEQGSSLSRIYRTYGMARAALGVLLVAALGIGGLLGARPSPASVVVCVAYGLQSVLLWLLPRYRLDAVSPEGGRHRRALWMSTVGIDLLAFMTLHAIEAATTFNYAALLVLPVMMAGVLSSRLRALATTSAVTLLLLAVAWQGAHAGGDLAPQMMQAGLAGIGLFLITLITGELAGRLAREELAARDSLELARQQAQLNRLVIEEMVDGVLVVDQALRVRAANPAARGLLVEEGLSPPAPLFLDSRPSWATLARAVSQALQEGDWPEAGSDVRLDFDAGAGRNLRVRVRFMRQHPLDAAAPAGERLCVLLLEDVRTAQARLRQEKLAAMGRVSAGVAHEIRNPLAAIAQANALLLEDELGPTQQRLARIVADNVERLKRIVDDVMEVAPGPKPMPGLIDLRDVVGSAVVDWARTVGLTLGPHSRLRVDLPGEPVGVRFDPEHMRRVLVNLLDNARRHATQEAGSIVLQLMLPDAQTATLAVLSDSPAIAPEVERHLFEPFFSTRSRGTGLGLYICRELCERYGAGIEFRQRPTSERLRNEFRVTMRRGPQPASPSTLSLVP